ncbi:MAG: TonB-dependent receptor, partial [Duncaniella dubosii]
SLFATAGYILNGNIAGGFAQTVLSNPALTWEKTYMTNFGLDFALFNSRLNGSIDIYNKDTKGILISLPAPLEHGTSVVPNQNAGEVRNR